MPEILYEINVVAERVGLSPQAIRAYVRQGLVPVCRQKGGLLFNPQALKRLERIRLLREFGVNTPGIEIILRLLERLEAAQGFGPRWLEAPLRKIPVLEQED